MTASGNDMVERPDMDRIEALLKAPLNGWELRIYPHQWEYSIGSLMVEAGGRERKAVGECLLNAPMFLQQCAAYIRKLERDAALSESQT